MADIDPLRSLQVRAIVVRMWVAVLRDFILVAAGAALLDWAGFGQLKNTARCFRPVSDDFTYSSTLFPRALVLPLAAAFLVYGRHFQPFATVAGLVGLALWMVAHGSLWVRLMLERVRNSP
jgi:hypothetical protein